MGQSCVDLCLFARAHSALKICYRAHYISTYVLIILFDGSGHIIASQPATAQLPSWQQLQPATAQYLTLVHKFNNAV